MATSGCQNYVRTGQKHRNRRDNNKYYIILQNLNDYHLFPLIGPPFDLMTSTHLLGKSEIRYRISSRVILSHSSCKAVFISFSESKTLRLIHCLIMFQMPSIGFRSSDWAGCLRFWMLWAILYSCAKPAFLIP